MTQQLSGGAEDTLYALFWFGPRESGEIPSKSGLGDLYDLGLAERRDVQNPPKGKDDYLAMLTPAGYEYAHNKYAINQKVKS